VVDADSADGTGAIARDWGAEVYSENELLPEYGIARGKGDAMWRSLSVARGDIVMFADADTRHFGEHFVSGTLGPLLTMPGLRFTKAAYRRPFTDTPVPLVDGGGRVTELMAKPLFNYFCPELAGFVQPLAGEFAADRELLFKIPFMTGYGVELGILVDVLREVGLPGMAQVDLGVRHNRHQPLWDLTRMSYNRAARDDAPRGRAGPRARRAGHPRHLAAPPARDVPARRGRRGRAPAGRAPRRAHRAAAHGRGAGRRPGPDTVA